MLTIRDAQMTVFRRLALADYVEWVTRQLRSGLQEDVAHLNDEELTAFIWAATDEANRLGITLQPDAARFVEYAVCFGLDLAATSALPQAAAILHDPDLDGTEKIARLDALDGAPLRF